MTTPESGASPIRERERETVRTARYAVIGAEPAQARRIWIALHGYGMLASRFLRGFVGAVPDDTCVVAPEGLSRFYLEMPRADGGHLQRVGATWLTRESRDTEIRDAHAWLDLVHDEVVQERRDASGDTPRVGVLGFSQGVATAMRWIAHGRVQPAQFIAWAGGAAQDVDRDAFCARMGDAELLFVMGTHDEFATAINRSTIESALQGLGVRHRHFSFNGKHHLDATLLKELLHGFGRE